MNAIDPSLLEENLQIKPLILLATLCLALVLGLMTSWTYKRTHQGVSYSRSVPLTLVVMPVVLATILLAIGSSIALSLGLVGSLSVLRFRTAIRDPRDMIYLFSAVATGLACGSGNLVLAVVGTTFAMLVFIVLEKMSWFTSLKQEFLLTLTLPEVQPNLRAQLEATCGDHCTSWNVKSSFSSPDGEEWTLGLLMKRGAAPELLMTDLRTKLGESSTLRMVTPESSVLY